MTMHRFFDVLFYSLVNFIAYVPLVVYPFRNRFRLSKALSYTIIGILCAGFTLMMFAVDQGLPAPLIPIIVLVVTTIVMKFGITEHIGKTLMTFLIEYNNATFVTVMAKALENYLFPGRVHTLYCWTHSILILAGLVPLYISDGIYSAKLYNDIVLIPNDRKIWKFIWITPMSYFLIWLMYTSTNQSYLTGTRESLFIILLLILFSMCTFITYYILLRLAFSEQENVRMEEQEKIITTEYHGMLQRIEDARKSRHDLRHHSLVLQTMAKDGDLTGIQDYLKQFHTDRYADTPMYFCEHYATNALLSYYARMAQDENVEFTVQCVMPQNIRFTERSLTVIFGNLLENAFTACRKVSGHKAKIDFRCIYEEDSMILKIANTTDQIPQTDEFGNYISTSHEGLGIGIESVRSVVRHEKGTMNITCENGMFEVSILMSKQ